MTEFYSDKRRADGLYSRCKTCHLEATQAYGATDKGKESKRNYSRSERGHKTHRDAAHKYSKSEKGRATIRAWFRDNWRNYYDPADPERGARWMINNAVRRGKLPPASSKVCERCGKKAKEYHHYKGYSRDHWLDVIPLCIPCDKKSG